MFHFMTRNVLFLDNHLGAYRLDESNRIPETSVVESGGLTGCLVDIDVRMVQQLVGDNLVVKDYRYAQRSVLDAMN